MDSVAVYFHNNLNNSSDEDNEADAYAQLELEPFFKKTSRGGIPALLKLATTLRFLAEGSYQQGVGQDFLAPMGQSTVSVVIAETVKILEVKCADEISFRCTEEERHQSKKKFYDKYGIPGVIGCIDGTHIAIIKPAENEHHFYNRKGWHSLNAMVCCDQFLKITSVNARYGGASNDSFVWSVSQERKYLEQNWRDGDRKSWLLGDSGYPLEPFVITPYRDPAPGSNNELFNKIHSKCRCTIERCFGVLKGRWRCLLKARELHYAPKKAVQIFNVCCMLHNWCKKYKIALEEELIVSDEEDVNLNLEDGNPATNRALAEAQKIRDTIRDNL